MMQTSLMNWEDQPSPDNGLTVRPGVHHYPNADLITSQHKG